MHDVRQSSTYVKFDYQAYLFSHHIEHTKTTQGPKYLSERLFVSLDFYFLATLENVVVSYG